MSWNRREDRIRTVMQARHGESDCSGCDISFMEDDITSILDQLLKRNERRKRDERKANSNVKSDQT